MFQIFFCPRETVDTTNLWTVFIKNTDISKCSSRLPHVSCIHLECEKVSRSRFCCKSDTGWSPPYLTSHSETPD